MISSLTQITADSTVHCFPNGSEILASAPPIDTQVSGSIFGPANLWCHAGASVLPWAPIFFFLLNCMELILNKAPVEKG